MAMQYDVKSFHATASSLAYAGRARLKGVVISPVSSTTFNSCVVDTAGALTGTYDIPGSTTCTVTIANHGLSNGDRVGLNFTSGTAVDDTLRCSECNNQHVYHHYSQFDYQRQRNDVPQSPC
jgi:hypothetical protein